jgi:hypothetical protein
VLNNGRESGESQGVSGTNAIDDGILHAALARRAEEQGRT